jgi:hypothetical protein
MDLGFRWASLGFWGSYGWIPMIAGPEEEGVGRRRTDDGGGVAGGGGEATR